MLHFLDGTLLKCGDVQGAEQKAREAFSCAEKAKDGLTEGQAPMALAQMCHLAGDYTGADKAFEKALDLLGKPQPHELGASDFFRYANKLEVRSEI